MIDWQQDWQAAREAAQRLERPLFLFLFSPG